MVRCTSKNGYQREIIFIEIGVHAENMIIILALIVNIFGGDLHDHLMSMRIKSIMIMNKIVIRAPQFMRTVVTTSMRIC